MKPKAAAKSHVRLAVYLRVESADQLADLMEALNVESRSALIAQALARWHHKEPLVHALQERRSQQERGKGEVPV